MSIKFRNLANYLRVGWVVFSLVWFSVSCSSSGELNTHAQNVKSTDTSPLQHDPCNFNRIDTEKPFQDPVAFNALMKKQNRDENGYESEMPLREAVNLFNIEQKCYAHRADLPPLTEDEVLAAILSVPDYGSKEYSGLQSKTLSQIALTRKVPKGSLFVHGGGGRVLNYPLGKDYGFAMESKGQTIYLFLDLEKVPNKGEFRMKPEQIFLVRKMMVNVTEVK